MGPLLNSARKRPKLAPHIGHTVARHVLDKRPQRTPRARGRGHHCRVFLPRGCPVASPAPFWSESRAALASSLASLLALLASSLASVPHAHARARPPWTSRAEFLTAATASTLSLLCPNQARHHLLLLPPPLSAPLPSCVTRRSTVGRTVAVVGPCTRVARPFGLILGRAR